MRLVRRKLSYKALEDTGNSKGGYVYVCMEFMSQQHQRLLKDALLPISLHIKGLIMR